MAMKKSKFSWIWEWTWNGIPVPIAFGGMAVIIIFLLVFQSFKPIRELKPFDPSVVPENTAIFIFDKNFTIKSVNEQKVNWGAGFSKAAYMSLPFGTYTFSLNFNDGNRSAKGLIVAGEFERGRIYRLSYSIDSKENTIQYSIREISNEDFAILKEPRKK